MPSRNSPQQERSRRTEQAIANALAALLQQKSFADIKVEEIAELAGVSVGGFYARFASKDALLELVELNILNEFNQLAAEVLDPSRFAGQGVSAITRAYAELLVTNFRARRVDIVQILRYTRARSATEERLRHFNVGVHDRVRALLLERSHEIGHADPQQAINLGLFIASAAAREAVLTRNLEVYPIELTDRELAEAIGQSFAAFLTSS